MPQKLQYLEGKRLPALKALDPNTQEYADGARAVGERLRETWERLVEENLLQATVMRLRPSVETKNLDQVRVLDEDWERVHHGMTRMNVWSHDTARATGAPPPSTDDLKKEIDEIRSLADKLKKDADKVRKDRTARLKNPSIPSVVGVEGGVGLVTAVVPVEGAAAPVNGAAEAVK